MHSSYESGVRPVAVERVLFTIIYRAASTSKLLLSAEGYCITVLAVLHIDTIMTAIYELRQSHPRCLYVAKVGR